MIYCIDLQNLSHDNYYKIIFIVLTFMNDLAEQTNFLLLVFCLFILSHFFLYEAASQLFVYSQQSSMWKRAVIGK